MCVCIVKKMKILFSKNVKSDCRFHFRRVRCLFVLKNLGHIETNNMIGFDLFFNNNETNFAILLQFIYNLLYIPLYPLSCNIFLDCKDLIGGGAITILK